MTAREAKTLAWEAWREASRRSCDGSIYVDDRIFRSGFDVWWRAREAAKRQRSG